MRLFLRSIAVALILLTPAPAHAWSFELHRFIMDRAIDMLPPGLKPFFNRNRAIAVERSVDPDTWRTMGFTEEDPHHFLNIDWPGYGAFPFRDLPRRYDAAVKKFGVAPVRAHGTLPWRIQEFYGHLRGRFQNIDRRINGRFELLLFSAALGHYVADATQPFHAVSNYDGQMTAQNGVHSRFERTLFARYRNRITVVPPSVPPVTDPLNFAFDTIIASSQLAAQVLKADRDALSRREVYDDAYFDALFRSTQPLLERRIGVAIGAVAAVVTGAWEAAGQPVVAVDTPQMPPASRRRR